MFLCDLVQLVACNLSGEQAFVFHCRLHLTFKGECRHRFGQWGNCIDRNAGGRSGHLKACICVWWGSKRWLCVYIYLVSSPDGVFSKTPHRLETFVCPQFWEVEEGSTVAICHCWRALSLSNSPQILRWLGLALHKVSPIFRSALTRQLGLWAQLETIRNCPCCAKERTNIQWESTSFLDSGQHHFGYVIWAHVWVRKKKWNSNVFVVVSTLKLAITVCWTYL